MAFLKNIRSKVAFNASFTVFTHITRRYASTKFEEVTIPVPWGHIAGKWWGPRDKRPVLTLHGWQDNCGSFNRLIPLLNEDVSFLAIDFPGHGLSSRLPPGLFYHFTNYLILVDYLMNYYKWSRISLMGHSLGGVTSFTYAMINPKMVDFIICIDASKPMNRPNQASRMGRIIKQFLRYDAFSQHASEPPSYTLEEINFRITTPHSNSVQSSHAHHLAERNIAPSKLHPGKYYFTRDPRLKAGELMNFPQEDTVESSQHMTSPMCIIKATESSYFEAKENFYQVLDVLRKHSQHLVYQKLVGTHHLHLNNPEIVAPVINDFIKKHNVGDGTNTTIEQEIKVKV